MPIRSCLIALLGLGLVAGPIRASDAEGNVGEIWSSPTSEYVMFEIDDGSARRHRCNTADRFSIDLSTPGGRHTFELIEAAKKAEWRVFVETLNTCNPYDAENVRYVIVR